MDKEFIEVTQLILPKHDAIQLRPTEFDMICNYFRVKLENGAHQTQCQPNIINFCTKVLPNYKI